MSRAARTLGAVVAAACCLAPAALTSAQADGHRGLASMSQRVPPHAQATAAPARTPVSIETLSPSRLEPGTPVTVTGTAFNDTDEIWGDVQVGMLVSSVPFTTQREVAAAASVDPSEDFVGEQVLAPGTFDDIGDIAPGQSRSYSFTVPFGELNVVGSEGVYRVGAEARATDGDGLRGPVARTLTFMPLLSDPKALPSVDLAMLWPVAAAVPWNGQRFLNGSLGAQFAEGGRLRALAELGVSSGDFPLTWMLDPAVLDAARHMSDGFVQGDTRVPADSAEATAATEWLQQIVRSIGSSVALAVPYGHPDVAALTHAGIRPGVRQAARASELVLDQLEINRLSLMWPASGRVDGAVLDAARQFDPDLALLARNTFSTPVQEAVIGLRSKGFPTSAEPQRTWQGLVVDRERSRAGLRVQPGQSALQWRQQILANTALRALGGDPTQRTAIAMPSRRWWPDRDWRDADLFDSLDVAWIETISIGELTTQPRREYRGGFRYPRKFRRLELGQQMLRGVTTLRRTSDTVNSLLADPTANRRETDKAFGLSSSVNWREDPTTGRRVVSDFVETNQDKIQGIDLETPSFVTLSSNSGRFPVSITNRLDEAVTVGLEVRSNSPTMSIEPVEPVTLQRDQRVTVSVTTSSQGVGITSVTARVLTQEGEPFGRSASFQVRTTQIGAVVWVVMAIGGAVLFVAAARRIITRVRAYRRSLRRRA